MGTCKKPVTRPLGGAKFLKNRKLLRRRFVGACVQGLATAVAVIMVTGLAYGASSSATGRASAVIAAGSGISSTSNLEVVLQPSPATNTDKEEQSAGAVPPRHGGSGKSSIQPAQFSVSGVPYQTFSVALPRSTLTETPQGTVVLTKFFHNAGAVPVIGSTGKGTFSVVGQVKRPSDLDSFVGGGLSGHRFNVMLAYN